MLLLNVLIFLNSAMLMLILNAYMCLKLFLGMSFKTKKVTHLYNYNSTFQRKKKHYFLQMIDRSRNHLYTSSYILQKNVYIYIYSLSSFHLNWLSFFLWNFDHTCSFTLLLTHKAPASSLANKLSINMRHLRSMHVKWKKNSITFLFLKIKELKILL